MVRVVYARHTIYFNEATIISNTIFVKNWTYLLDVVLGNESDEYKFLDWTYDMSTHEI